MTERHEPRVAEMLEIRRTLEATPEKVFAAWVDPAKLRKWWGVSDEYETTVAEVDPRPSGSYRLGMKVPGKQAHVVGGVFREVYRPRKLSFTWKWENDEKEKGESLVTVDFRDVGGKTKLVLRHDGLSNDESRQAHEHGWNGCLLRLPKAIV